jgi:hypothetical protein
MLAFDHGCDATILQDCPLDLQTKTCSNSPTLGALAACTADRVVAIGGVLDDCDDGS